MLSHNLFGIESVKIYNAESFYAHANGIEFKIDNNQTNNNPKVQDFGIGLFYVYVRNEELILKSSELEALTKITSKLKVNQHIDESTVNDKSKQFSGENPVGLSEPKSTYIIMANNKCFVVLSSRSTILICDGDPLIRQKDIGVFTIAGKYNVSNENIVIFNNIINRLQMSQ